ncbi:hypothetical protein Bpfe_027238 [Biomphalaria pfeifferi]|uniref:Uncharacterized protein n=1 Tax=Biomphalaria pfeifferi TaxID=112525 RepID=A0AAD8EWT0_BIOPF|nr:hypothetical protein Bpfe_027238 [Biomphalaria pfeifferi]
MFSKNLVYTSLETFTLSNWNEHELCQTQIQYSLDVLEGLGILTSTKPEPTECSGLAMPEFPQLSPVECHALIFADQLPDTKPKLSWSPKPFSGDVQVTWQLVGITDISTTNIKRIFGVIQREFKHICLFSHLWNQGVLLKFKNNSATVCMEQSSNGLKVSCRVSGDDPGQELMVVMSLWAHLVPVIRAVEHFCNHFLPGFLYKVNLILLGDVFYNVSEPMPAEPVISYFKLLVAKRTGNHFIITEGGTGTINLDLLFPFSCEESRKVWTPQEWNQFVMNKYDEILNTVSPQLPATSHRQSFKVSCRKYKQRRKIAEVKWSQNLAEVKFDSFCDLTLAEYMDSEVVKDSEHKVESCNPENNPGNTARETITQTSVKMTKSECTQTDGCLELSVSTSDDWLKEATSVASKFVSTAMASGVAKYITTYGLCSGGIQIATSAEIAVAQITAEAASAVYNNDMYAAARAIIKAVQTVHETAASSNRNVASTSRLCTLL